jgi:hypothetical protein
MRILHNTEAMSHVQLFFWLWMTVLGHAIVQTKGRLPAWRTAVNAMIQQPFMDVHRRPGRTSGFDSTRATPASGTASNTVRSTCGSSY